MDRVKLNYSLLSQAVQYIAPDNNNPIKGTDKRNIENDSTKSHEHFRHTN